MVSDVAVCIVQMLQDKKFTKIKHKMLQTEDWPLARGGFGAVYKSKYLTVK